jgi:hypothetical protein
MVGYKRQGKLIAGWFAVLVAFLVGSRSFATHLSPPASACTLEDSVLTGSGMSSREMAPPTELSSGIHISTQVQLEYSAAVEDLGIAPSAAGVGASGSKAAYSSINIHPPASRQRSKREHASSQRFLPSRQYPTAQQSSDQRLQRLQSSLPQKRKFNVTKTPESPLKLRVSWTNEACSGLDGLSDHPSEWQALSEDFPGTDDVVEDEIYKVFAPSYMLSAVLTDLSLRLSTARSSVTQSECWTRFSSVSVRKT